MKKFLLTFLMVFTTIINTLNFSCTKKTDLEEAEFNAIVEGFQNPEEDNTVWCYWYWINDDISKEGISRDLEAMKKAGIGAAFIGNINPAGVDGRVPLFSDAWWECMVHAVTEGHRIGVDIGIFNCPGWSQSGGPWVKPDMAMRYLVYSETKVKGPGMVQIKLKSPSAEFQDTHTLACKLPEVENRNLKDLNARIILNQAGLNPLLLIDNDPKTGVEFAKNQNITFSADIVFNEKITARQFSLTPLHAIKCDCELYASLEGEEKLVGSFLFDRSNFSVNVGPMVQGPVAISLADVYSDHFRLVCTRFSGRAPKAGFAEINISEAPVLERFVEKQLGKMHPTPLPEWNTYVWDTQQTQADPSLLTSEVTDISEQVDKDGILTWNAPEGEWNIMRFGMTPTGTRNSPSAPQGQGYEIDKMNKDLVRIHFENFVGEFLKRIPEESKPAFKYVIADSYEMGSQNWTNGYELKFREKFGYDPVKYLPVLSGRIVGSIEESERFLWDLRRSVADDVAREYVGGLKAVSNEHGLQTWLENYGHWGFPSEFMMYGGQSDLIGGEFWNEGTLGNIECKASSSTAHTYGKGRTSAEAFTASQRSYLRHPAELKKRGDWSFTEGINHMVLHVYIHQPDDQRVPGMNAWFSTEFNRHNTWFSQANHYLNYLRRSQFLLQQGRYAADVCYFIGESAPIMTGGRIPEIPEGYSYDYINAEVILNRMSVENGRFVLPDGMSYRIMVLPPLNTMRPEILEKIKLLVSQGGVVLGKKPEKSPSLQNYPECDKKVSDLADSLWGGAYQDDKMRYEMGKGLVLDGYDLTSALNILGVDPDLITDNQSVLWTHRTMPGMEIYFLTNQSDEEIRIEPSFRTTGMKPQLWDAVTGEMRFLGEYRVEGGRTAIPLTMEGRRSWFVVFTKNNHQEIKEMQNINFPGFETWKTIDGPFDVVFENTTIGPGNVHKFNTLASWSLSENEKIRSYSGTASYRVSFTVDKITDEEIFLNLGEVAVVAEVVLNGKIVGGTWIIPHRLNITGDVKTGSNDLEIRVANLWRNRMIADERLPDNERYTWTVVEDIAPDEEYHVSGLLGPVTLEHFKVQ